MCPACIGSTLALLTGASSLAAGGLAALKLRSLRRMRFIVGRRPKRQA